MRRRSQRSAPPAYLFFGAFTQFPPLLEDLKSRLVERFGALHPRGESEIYPFPETHSYRPTMGEGLSRRFFVLDELRPQDCLASVKHASVEMEETLRSSGDFPVERPINIDPGLINDCRVILASTKDYAHRLYRGDGIWEEITLYYEKGSFRAHPWTYPDFRATTYHAFFEFFRGEFLRNE